MRVLQVVSGGYRAQAGLGGQTRRCKPGPAPRPSPPLWATRQREACVGSPTQGGSLLYLRRLLGGQMLQVGLDLGQQGVQHVQDGEQYGVV